MIYQRVVVIYQRIFLPVRAFLKFPEHARFWGERQSTPVRPPGSTRAGERRFPARRAGLCRKGKPCPSTNTFKVCSQGGVPVVQSAGSASGLFLLQKGLFLRGWGCCPGFHDGKKGHFLTRLHAEGTESAWAPLCAEKRFTGSRCSRGTGSFFRAGRGIPHHRAVPRLFSSHAGRQRMFCLARMPLQGLFYGGGELRQAPGRRGMMSGPMPCAFFSLAQGRMHKRCREKAFPAGG